MGNVEWGGKLESETRMAWMRDVRKSAETSVPKRSEGIIGPKGYAYLVV